MATAVPPCSDVADLWQNRRARFSTPLVFVVYPSSNFINFAEKCVRGKGGSGVVSLSTFSPPPAMSFAVVAGSADALQVLPFCPLRIIHSIKWHDVVNIISRSILAHLAHWALLSLQYADAFPLTPISPALL